jgi:DNA invertase Pin-like site-specific DNA recombinase
MRVAKIVEYWKVEKIMYDYIVQQFMADELLFYLRKSRTDDPLMTVAEVLERHEQQLDEWVERNAEGGAVPEQNRYREVGSGETIADRPRLQELLRRVESPKVRALVIKDTSRLSRGDMMDIGYLVKILKHTNTRVITLDRGVYDLNNDRDLDDFKRELMRGNEYLEYTKKIQNAGRVLSAQAGHYLGSIAPYGYKKISYKEGKKTVHTLEPLPEQAEVVKRIFEMYSQGLGSERICDVLNGEHIPAPKGKLWQRETITHMLANVHYLGKIKWNWRKAVIRVEDGEVIKSRPKHDDYIISEGKHDAIVSQELWDAVQAIRGQIPRNHKAKNIFNPLAGLVYCKVCGRAIVGRKYNDKNGRERSAPRMLCGGRKQCEQGSARMSEVLDEVVKVLEGAVEEFELRIDSGTDDCAEQHRLLIDRLEKRLAALREKEIKQWEEKMERGMPEHVFKKLNDATVAEIDEVQQTLHDAVENTPQPVDLGERIVTFKAALEAVRDPEAPVKEVNRLLKACIERIEYSREKYSTGGVRPGTCETPIVVDFTLRI